MQQTNICGMLKDVQALCLEHNLSIEFTCKKVQEGWSLKPKGMMQIQILWERGYIDPNKSVRNYTVNVKKLNKDDNNFIPSTSLRELICNLPNFAYKTTLLQF